MAGGAGDEVEVHVGVFDPAGPLCDSLVQQGGPVIQQRATAKLEAALVLTASRILVRLC